MTKLDPEVTKSAGAPDSARVFVLYTGGTFGMAPDERRPGSPLRPLPLRKLEQEMRELTARLVSDNKLERDIIVDCESVDKLIDSSSMKPEYWVDMARRIHSVYEDYDGFVIVQGTDTLAYTASALSFIFENLGKPVVVTGSQLPLKNPRTDALLNFGHSMMLAAYRATDLPIIPEVVVVFADKVLRGCRTRKMSASSWTGFESPNAPLLGEIGEHIRIYEDRVRPAPSSDLKLQINDELVPDVLDMSLFPGLKPEHLKTLLSLDGIEGVVFRTYGTGNAPEDQDFINALRDGISDDDKVVVNISQCPQGSVEMGLYAASVALLDNGVISGLDMTPEAALTKLMVTMGSRVGDRIKLQMQISQRGEQSQNLFDLKLGGEGKYVSKPLSKFVVPDRRFDPIDLSTTVLRMRGLQVQADNELWPDFDNSPPPPEPDEEMGDGDFGDEVPMEVEGPRIFVYMNFPKASLETGGKEHARCVRTITIRNGASFDVVEVLSKEKIKNVIGDSDITLTLVPEKGIKIKFDDLSLSLFSQA